jgi:hypothetical protein
MVVASVLLHLPGSVEYNTEHRTSLNGVRRRPLLIMFPMASFIALPSFRGSRLEIVRLLRLECVGACL